MKLIFLIITFLFCSEMEGQVIKQPLSLHYVGLGGYSKNFTDIFSATSNQAAIANIKTAAVAVFGERRFMLSELSGYTTIIAVPTAHETIGFQADYFGSSSFNESELGFIYARKVSEGIDVGAKFNYHMVRVAGYGNASAVNFDVSAIFHLTEKLHAGLRVYNPAGSRLGKSGSEKLASIYSFGLGYEASEKLFISTEIVKNEDLPVGINAGFQYNLHPRVFIRSGISTNNSSSYVSVGLNIGFGRIDINTAYHSQLGFTPGVLLLVNFKKAVEE